MFLIDEISSIEEVECDSLRFDITVEDNNNFFANDILVHNCQNLTNEWEQLHQYTYEVTEKLEGSSMTVGMVDDEFIVCSRNLNLKETEGNTLWAMARKYAIEAKMRLQNITNMIIQGEVIGEGIQGNHYGIKGQKFYVYSMFDPVKGEYISPQGVRNNCYVWDLDHVPVIAENRDLSKDINLTIEDVLKFADGKSLLNPNVLREGDVYKRIDGQEHFKAVSNEYLLKHGG